METRLVSVGNRLLGQDDLSGDSASACLQRAEVETSGDSRGVPGRRIATGWATSRSEGLNRTPGGVVYNQRHVARARQGVADSQLRFPPACPALSAVIEFAGRLTGPLPGAAFGLRRIVTRRSAC
jgi:hypothetical protein